MILHSYLTGNPSHPPLIILHGLFGSGDNWRTVGKMLADAFYVVAFDLRNHGRSGHATEMRYEHLAGDVAQSMDDLDIDNASVIGHSMGGKTAMHLALLRPDLVDRLIVVDIAPRAHPPEHLQILKALCSLDVTAVGSRNEALRELKPDIPDERVRRFLIKNLVPANDHGYKWIFNLPAIRQNYPAIIGGIDSFDLFEKPALFIRGKESTYFSEADFETARAYFYDADMVTLRGGHWVHADDTDNFVREVKRFLVPNPEE